MPPKGVPHGESLEVPDNVEGGGEKGSAATLESEPVLTDTERKGITENNLRVEISTLQAIAPKKTEELATREHELENLPPPRKMEFTGQAKEAADLETAQARLAESQTGQERPGGTGEAEQSQPVGAEAPEGTVPAEEPGAEQTSAENQAQSRSEIPAGSKPAEGNAEQQPLAEEQLQSQAEKSPDSKPGQEEAEKQPEKKNIPNPPREAKAEVKPTPEQIQAGLAQALDKIFTEIKSNSGKMPENSAGLDDLKGLFPGAEAGAIDKKIEQLGINATGLQTEEDPSSAREKFKKMGQDVFRDLNTPPPQENPPGTPESPLPPPTEERKTSQEPDHSPDISGQNDPMSPKAEDKT